MRKNLLRSCFILHPSAFILLLCAGCGALGVIVNKMAPRTEAAKYTGMAGESAAVMVWADRAIKIEWDRIQSDLANAIQNSLYANPAKELKETKWPWPPESIVRYQLDHPGIEAQPITQVAPKLVGVTRLLYVEVERLSTRGDASAQMFRGQITASLKIVEVQGTETRIGYEETGITAAFPPKSPPEGVLNSNDYDIYRGTIAMLAREIVDRLVAHEQE